jgi:hypothetical protein
LKLDFSTGAQLSDIIYEMTTKDLNYDRKEGTAQFESWFTSPITGTALTTGAVVAGRLYAIPFVVPKRIRIDRIAINVTTLGTGNARMGIYESDEKGYPSKRLCASAEVSVSSTGVKSATVDVVLMPGLKWLVVVAAGTPTLRSFAVASLIPILGHGSSLGTAANFGLYVAYAYAALPATFPSSPTMITAVPIPTVFVRLV